MSTVQLTRALVIGGGNGGKATAADLALRGLRVRLFEFPDWSSNLDAIRSSKMLRLTDEQDQTYDTHLEEVTTDMRVALHHVDAIIVCTQSGSLETVAESLVEHMNLCRNARMIVLNPGSAGGALVMYRVFVERGVPPHEIPPLVEFHTLAFGCRASEDRVNIEVRVKRLLFGVLPAVMADSCDEPLRHMFPSAARVASGTVLEVGLNNTNPIIHPAITLCNIGAIERFGDQMQFYQHGVTPMVARLIEKLDVERMALLTALGFEAQSDPKMSVQEGYADNDDYLQCYSAGVGYARFAAPASLEHCRYFDEDVGLTLVLYRSLGQFLRVPTPATDAVIQFAGIVYDRDYLVEPKRTVVHLGISHLSQDALRTFLHSAMREDLLASAANTKHGAPTAEVTTTTIATTTESYEH